MRVLAAPPAFAFYALAGFYLLIALWIWLKAGDTERRYLASVQPAASVLLRADRIGRGNVTLGDMMGGGPETGPSAGGPALRPAPFAGLSEAGTEGRLPRVALDGRHAWLEYAAPFEAAPGTPLIAIVIGDLGRSEALLDHALARLPPETDLAFLSYGAELQAQIDAARAAGHESWLSVPMEPLTFPTNDPGPDALLSGLPADQNIHRLRIALAKAEGYVGVVPHMGSRFTAEERLMRPVLEEVNNRGLAFLDARSAELSVGELLAAEMKLPHAVVLRRLDVDPRPDSIDAALDALERAALAEGSAVGMGVAYPVTIDRLLARLPQWREKGIALAPLTAVIRRGQEPAQ
jgi:polysaccharide deacetylase 2 family uncharacterized protein YibQ